MNGSHIALLKELTLVFGTTGYKHLAPTERKVRARHERLDSRRMNDLRRYEPQIFQNPVRLSQMARSESRQIKRTLGWVLQKEFRQAEYRLASVG